MRFSSLSSVIVTALVVTACGSSTDVQATRYNFAVVDGRNQSSIAGTPTLAKPITAMLTRDPEGRFATRVFDFFAPSIAYAQGIILQGEPVEGQIVCGEESDPGEPKVVPLCAYTLSDGKAANVVQGGTKVGVYTMRFTAQNVGTEPVKDSTTVAVEPGPIALNAYSETFSIMGKSPFEVDHVQPSRFVQDQYGNAIPYRLVPSGLVHTMSDTLGAPSARTLIADQDGQGTIAVIAATGTIATGVLTVSGTGTTGSQIRLDFTSSP